jgi:primosomal protein N' (replication factor Y)
VATPKLFRLKAEVAPASSGPRALVLPYARVRVDTGVFHLDQLYEYQIPEKLSHLIQVGIRIQVPFGTRETEGIVVERVGAPDRAGEIKSISKVISPHPVATPSSLRLIDSVASHFGCNSWDVVRSAIPPRVAAVDKTFQPGKEHQITSTKPTVVFQSLEPFTDSYVQVSNVVHSNLSSGSVLVVAPDEKDVDRIVQQLAQIGIPSLKLTAALARQDRYRNYLESLNAEKCVVVGTRSAVFAPVANLSTIIIFKESSYEHYEVRSPGWNTRTVARMRATNESLSLVFTGFTPSIEIAQAIEDRSVTYISSRHTVKVKAFAPSDGALLPGRIFTDIKKALATGPVLFLAPRKGYGNAVLCSHCRNIAMCHCGGRLSVSAKGLAPACVHCGASYPLWRCEFCNRDKQYLAGRGVERAAEEIARAFPNYPVVISAGDVIKDRVEAKPSLVLATPGAQPHVKGGYSAVVILDAMRFFSHTDLRTHERARELLFESSSLITPEGAVLLVIDDSHPIVAGLTRWNVAPLIKRELSERTELHLPPTVSSAVLVMEKVLGANISAGLRKSVSDGRLPHSTRIYGPTEVSKGEVKIVLHVAREDAQSLVSVLHELQRRRSIAKKDLFTLRIDPYSL